MKYKKMTRKEVESELSSLNAGLRYMADRLNKLESVIFSIGKTLDEYLNFSGNRDKFVKHIEKVKKDKEKNESKKKATKKAPAKKTADKKKPAAKKRAIKKSIR